MYKWLIVLAVCGLVTFNPILCEAASIKVYGSTTVQKAVLEPHLVAFRDKTGIRLRIRPTGTGQGCLKVFLGKAKICGSSSSLESTIRSAQKIAEKEGYPFVLPDDVNYIHISKDTIAPIVNVANQVSALSWNQLKEIYIGKITNWSGVGGENRPIKVVISHPGSATRSMFQKSVLKGMPYTSYAIEVASTRDAINEVSRISGAISALSLDFIRTSPGKTKRIETEEIVRPLAFIVRGKPEGDLKTMIDYFKMQMSKGNGK